MSGADAPSAGNRSSPYDALRHCEERSDEAIQLCGPQAGLLRTQRRLGRRIRGHPPYNALRHCHAQGDEAALAAHSVIARSEATKQSSFVVRKLDCFAALAMTAGSAHSRSSRITHSVIARSEATKQS